MALPRPFNVLIAGVGGQGVFSLTRVFWALCADAGQWCQGSTFKGGAQTLGSIHSWLRLYSGPQPQHDCYSTQILRGDLDLMIGLEPWETLRHHAYFGPRTRVYMNAHVRPLLAARSRTFAVRDPVAAVRALGVPLVCRDYTAQATRELGSWKMANFLMGRDVVAAGDLPFSESDYVGAFAYCVPRAAPFHPAARTPGADRRGKPPLRSFTSTNTG